MQILSGRGPRRSLPLLALAVLVAGAAVGSLASAAESDTTIQACRHKVTGRLRAVEVAGACRPSETPLSWNKEGQPGPTGPAGPPGPKGDPGAGLSKLNGLDGLACTRDDGTNGTVDLEIANDGDVTLLCTTGDSPPPPPPPPPTGGKLVINEVDYDQVGTDGDGFVEIENIGSQPVDLANVALVLVDGADSLEYARRPLTGTLAPGAFAVVDVDPQNGAPDGVRPREHVDARAPRRPVLRGRDHLGTDRRRSRPARGGLRAAGRGRRLQYRRRLADPEPRRQGHERRRRRLGLHDHAHEGGGQRPDDTLSRKAVERRRGSPPPALPLTGRRRRR
jgi:hypothetical protein